MKKKNLVKLSRLSGNCGQTSYLRRIGCQSPLLSRRWRILLWGNYERGANNLSSGQGLREHRCTKTLLRSKRSQILPDGEIDSGNNEEPRRSRVGRRRSTSSRPRYGAQNLRAHKEENSPEKAHSSFARRENGGLGGVHEGRPINQRGFGDTPHSKKEPADPEKDENRFFGRTRGLPDRGKSRL